MDKSSQHTYRFDKQILIVERHFAGEKSIRETVKEYMSEQMRKTPEIDGAAAFASAKEDGK